MGSCAPCTPNSAAEALDALVNAALMAGENVTERIVRKVFSDALDVVVHLDRDDVGDAASGTIRRQVMEIAAVVPALRDDFTIEPLFVRVPIGARRCEWTGAQPSRLDERARPRALPRGEVAMHRRSGSRGMTLLAALAIGRLLLLRRRRTHRSHAAARRVATPASAP